MRRYVVLVLFFLFSILCYGQGSIWSIESSAGDFRLSHSECGSLDVMLGDTTTTYSFCYGRGLSYIIDYGSLYSIVLRGWGGRDTRAIVWSYLSDGSRIRSVYRLK